MIADEILEKIRATGIEITTDDFYIYMEPEPSADLLELVRKNKEGIIDLLILERFEKNRPEAGQGCTHDPAPVVNDPPPVLVSSQAVQSGDALDHAELMTERAAIREYDGGQPRDQAEQEAAEEIGPCYVCGSGRFWVSTYGVIVCERCHPPATPKLIERTITIDIDRAKVA